MDRVALFVNDEALDLKDGEKISITFQAQSFSKLEDKQGSFSRSFQLPMTDKNKRLLENANVFGGKSSIPYKVITAYLYVNGVMIQPGNLIIENDGVSKNEIRVTYYTGNSLFFQLVNKVKLKDGCFIRPDVYWSRNFIRDGIAIENGIAFPIIDYTNDGYYIKNNLDTVYFERLLPAVGFQTLLEGVENTTGYKIKGEILNTDDFQKLFFPTSGPFLRDSNYQRRNTWVTHNTTPFNVPSQAETKIKLADSFLTTQVDYGKFAIGNKLCNNTIVPYRELNGGAGIKEHRTFMFPDRVRVKMKLTLQWTNTGSANASDIYIKLYNEVILNGGFADSLWYGNDPTLNNPTGLDYSSDALKVVAITSNGTPGSEIISLGTGFNELSFGNYNQIPVISNSYTTEIQFEIDVIPHTLYILTLESSFTNLNISETKWEVTYIRDNGTTEEDREIRQLDYNTTESTRSWISVSTPAPDITMAEFLKSIAQLFGCIFIVDDNLKEVTVFTWKELFYNLPNAKDWSDKVVNLDNAIWNTRANGYGQINVMFYDNEDDVSDVLGEKTFLINDTTLPANANIIKVPYSATDMKKKLNNRNVPYIARYDNGQYQSGKQRILYMDNQSTWTLTYSSDPALGAAVTGTQSTDIPMCYFIDGSSKRQLGFSQYLYDNYYRYIEYVLNDYKQLTVQMLLSQTDIKQLDYRYPIYLKQFASYFFIEKIQDWTPGKPCKVVLLKLQ